MVICFNETAQEVSVKLQHSKRRKKYATRSLCFLRKTQGTKAFTASYF